MRIETESDARRHDRRLLEDAVREGGALARRYFERGFKSWEKKPGDPVSEADLAVDSQLREALGEERPTYGWLSEETEDNPDRLSRAKVWVVDPIDGTRAFVKGKPQFAVCAALVEHCEAVLGAVFNPMTDEFFVAEAGAGAWLNGETIRVSGATSLDGARLLASRRTFEQHQWTGLVPHAHFEAVNSIAYRMALIANGAHDATISLAGKSDWDIAAADLIVREAGGRCTDGTGAAFVYNGESARHPSVLAATPALHGPMLDILNSR